MTSVEVDAIVTGSQRITNIAQIDGSGTLTDASLGPATLAWHGDIIDFIGPEVTLTGTMTLTTSEGTLTFATSGHSTIPPQQLGGEAHYEHTATVTQATGAFVGASGVLDLVGDATVTEFVSTSDFTTSVDFTLSGTLTVPT